MMTGTIVVRRVAATPARSAAEAWAVIAALVAPGGSTARGELDRVAGIAAALIAGEAMRDAPIVVHGVGPRLRVYCAYDDEAILAEGVIEEPLAWCPTDGDWAMSFPCPPEDLAWVQPALARASTRVTARDLAEPTASDGAAQRRVATDASVIDVEAFLRP